MTTTQIERSATRSGLKALARYWRRGMASLLVIGSLAIAATGASAAGVETPATLAPLHTDTGALSVDQGKPITLEVVKQLDGHGLQDQKVDWVVTGPGKASLSAKHSQTLAQGKDVEAGTARTVFTAKVPGRYVVTANTQKNPGCVATGCATWVSTRFAIDVNAIGSEAAGGSTDSTHSINPTVAAAAAALVGAAALVAAANQGSDHALMPTSHNLGIVSGNGQSAPANTALPAPLVVNAFDGTSVPVAGVAIHWTVSSGGAILSSYSSNTDGSGNASVNVTNVGSSGGPFTITAARGDYPNATVTFTGNVLVPSLTIVSGNNQSGFAGQNSQPLVVQALLGTTPQPNVSMTWSIGSGNATIASVSNGGLTDSTGSSSAIVHFGNTAGPVTVTAIRNDNGASQTFNLVSTITNSMAISSGNGQTACPLLPLPQNMVVQTLTNNNPTAGVTVNWLASSGTLSAATSTSNGSGLASIQMTNVGPDYQATASTLQITATNAADPTATTTFTQTVPASTLAVASGNGQSGLIGGTSAPFVVNLVDGCGHAIVNQPVAWTVVSGSATLSASSVNTNGSGQSQVTVTYGATPGAIVIQASALGGGLTSQFNATATTSGVSASAGNNQTGNPGVTLPIPLTVTVTPAVAGVPVTFQVASGSATVVTTSTTTNASGVASTQLQLGLTPGPVVVNAIIGGSVVASFNATVNGTLVGTAMSIVSGNNQVIAPNVASQPMVVQLNNGSSPLSGQTINWSASGGTLSSASTTTGGNGQTSVTLTPTSSGPVTVTATFPGYAAYTTSQITFAENTTLAAVATATTNAQSVAHALDSACASLLGMTNLTPQQQDTLNQCLALGQASTVSQGAVNNAINQMVPAVAQTQTTTAITAANTQFSNLAGRMQAVRGGAQGLSFAGLAFANSTGSLSLGDVGSALLGADDQKQAADSSGFARWGFFASGQIQRQDARALSSTPGYSFGSNGVTFGADYRVNDRLVLGGALGYTHQSTTLDLGQGNMSMNGWSLSAYGTWYNKSDWYLDSSLTWANNSFDAHRAIAYAVPLPGGSVSTVNQVASSSSGGNDFAGSVTFGRDFHQKALAYGFYGKLQYDHASFNSFAETMASTGPGSGLALRVDARSTTSIASVLGAKLDYNISTNWGVMVPHGEVEWQHEYRTDPNSFTAYFIDDPTNTPILIHGNQTDSDFFRLGAGMSFVFTQGRSAFLLYNRSFGRQGITEYNISFGFRMEF